MMKKTIFFMLCLMPMGVQAAVPDNLNDGGVITDLPGYTFSEGFTLSNLFVQSEEPSDIVGQTLYVIPMGDTGAFSLYYQGATTGTTVTVSGNLTVNSGLDFTFGSAPGASNAKINMTLGTVTADGALNLSKIATLETGNITSADNLNISDVDAMDSGVITITGGTENAVAVNNTLQVDGIINNPGSDTSVVTSISAAAIDVTNSGNIGNSNQFSTLDITATSGAITVGGSVSNSGDMNITAANTSSGGDITITGTVTNAGDMVIKGQSLAINGEQGIAGQETAEASFFNSGNLIINVTGKTFLASGFDLSNMTIDNTFHLTTGSLDFGASADIDRWLSVFSNKLTDFKLVVINGVGDDGTGALNLQTSSGQYVDVINNSAEEGTYGYNPNANMIIHAPVITMGNVSNYGNSLQIGAYEGDDSVSLTTNSITVNGDVYAAQNAQNTEINSAGGLTIEGAVSNTGEYMALTGATGVYINDVDNESSGSVSNSGGKLEILSLTSGGVIDIEHNVANRNGELFVNATNIDIGGALLNYSGITTVQGASSTNADNSLSIGSIEVQSGTLNMNGLGGGINVNGNVTITGGENGGLLNVGTATKSLTAEGSINIDGDVIVGAINQSAQGGNGDLVVSATGVQSFDLISNNVAGGNNDDSITIGGQINVSADGAHNITVAADTISVGESVVVKGAENTLTFGTTSSNTRNVTVDGDVSATLGADLSINSLSNEFASLTVDETSALVLNGNSISTTNDIQIGGGLWFDGINPRPGTGSTPMAGIVVANGISDVELASSQGGISIGGVVDLGDDTIPSKILKLTAAEDVSLGGVIIGNSAKVDVAAPKLNIASDLTIDQGALMTVAAARGSNAGSVDITAGDVEITGNVVHGTPQGAVSLNLVSQDTNFTATSLTVTGNYNVYSGNSGTWNITNGAEITGLLNVDSDAVFALHADGITLGSTIENSGDLTLDSGEGVTSIAAFNVPTINNDGTITLAGAGLTTPGQFLVDGILYQVGENGSLNLKPGQIGIISDNYTISTSSFQTNGINQTSGALVVSTNSVNVLGNIDAVDVRFEKIAGDDSWMTASVNGDVSGGVDFWGIKSLDITGSYTFNNNSDLWAAVFPYNASGTGNTSSKNYWATIEATDSNSVGEITNAENGEALISVSNQFVSEMTGVYDQKNPDQPMVGISLFKTVDQGTAIWLLHAENGIIVENQFDKLRNLNVQFCNADGSLCIDYASTLRPGAQNNGSGEELPIYITERDTDGDGMADSLYVVFNPAFGGPIEITKLQPIVDATPSHTEGEYVSAGALDDLIEGQLLNTGFALDSPIEVIPVMFQGSNFQTMAQELYNRLDYYSMTGERDPLARFSRLFQARELEQIAGAVALNEHTNFRDFEDRMFDEFIWNRNRSLKKAWLDVDYGMFRQDASDSKRIDGDRFSIAGGFDWQESETLILGLTAHISNSSSDNSDLIDLTYKPNAPILGTVDITVDDLNIGFGGYMMQTLGEKTRLYGNAFLDVHMFDISRDQTYMSHIDGTGTAFSVIGEMGLLHDWLNQYIVGNAYARIGYNFGFDITEHADGQDYMDMQSDGYLILTPGYSLIAQKRIYPSAWFQIRPYASIGVEYDVLGAPDFVKYKFAPAHTYTRYDVDIDPLWANVGGGIEFLSASGIQVGIDYRYQYNDAIQLHNIKVSGSYRF